MQGPSESGDIAQRIVGDRVQFSALHPDSHSNGRGLMATTSHAYSQDQLCANTEYDLKEIVMGLHWDPQGENLKSDPDDLDALCALIDAQDRVLEVIHSGRPRNANDSVVHTGDSRSGASEWDDERIFVFLRALPQKIDKLVFVVACATGKPLGEIRGASCHVSDCDSERKCFQLELTSLRDHTVYCVATLHRSDSGWTLSSDLHRSHQGLLEELMALPTKVKGDKR